MYQLNDRINNLKNTIALSCADLRGCTTRAQVQSINAFINTRKAELAALEEKAFINRCVAVLDTAGMGEHNVYIYWFRIDYGCWLDAEEVVNAGGLADYLESLGMEPADVAELMTQDWDCQDAEGLASHCLHKYGSFDWTALEELLEVDCEPEVLAAGLACEIAPEEIEGRYMGAWDSDEDMAAEQWEEGGLLEAIPASARGYIDWQAVARDMELNGEFVKSGDYYFRNC
ncbi:antirestriction protein ArdA [Aeromonas rivipollensis]|uniref:antirestriction protein ArdA n=1 Tax=Aeromonas rivipollensis TaxID=948519 RepID=UPI0029771CDB|nr:antirestriction protein ArdA [Aeromonas rivipollensis]